jgi:hypothetical protein
VGCRPGQSVSAETLTPVSAQYRVRTECRHICQMILIFGSACEIEHACTAQLRPYQILCEVVLTTNIQIPNQARALERIIPIAKKAVKRLPLAMNEPIPYSPTRNRNIAASFRLRVSSISTTHIFLSLFYFLMTTPSACFTGLLIYFRQIVTRCGVCIPSTDRFSGRS